VSLQRSLCVEGQMSDDDRSIGTPGLKSGCATSALVGGPLIFFSLGGAALGHCAPGSHCVPGWALILGAIAIAALAGLIVGALVNRRSRS
jgi:hypothetical protein